MIDFSAVEYELHLKKSEFDY